MCIKAGEVVKFIHLLKDRKNKLRVKKKGDNGWKSWSSDDQLKQGNADLMRL